MKKHNGFTLIEVLVAVGVVVFTLGFVVRMQTQALHWMRRGIQEIDRVFYIKKYAYKWWRTLPKKEKKRYRLDDPKVIIDLAVEPISAKSSLKEFSQDIVRLSCVGRWKSTGLLRAQEERDLTMIGFVTKPHEKKK